MTRLPDPTRIIYKAKTPLWMKKAIERYKRHLSLDKWKIEVRLVTQRTLEKLFGERMVGYTYWDNDYKTATIYLNKNLKRFEDDSTIFHELGHLWTAENFSNLVENHILPHVHSQKRELLTSQYNKTIESVIESLWLVYRNRRKV